MICCWSLRQNLLCKCYVTPSEAEIERFWHIGCQKPLRWWEPEIHLRAWGPFIRVKSSARKLAEGQFYLAVIHSAGGSSLVRRIWLSWRSSSRIS